MTREQRDRLRKTLAAILVVAVLLTLLFRKQLAPMAEQLLTTQVDNQASDAINEAIQQEMSETPYETLVTIEKRQDGAVTAVQTDIAAVNRLKTDILKRVDQRLENLSTEELGVPIGSVILPELFSGRGPDIPVRVIAVRASDATFLNSFTAAGINQTLHRITIEVNVVITILTWTGTQNVTVQTSVLAAETVIVGTVPTTYFGVEAEP
ncbi:MAG: sporulation protein YunB [Oscillospiraceae bacterium]|nr:sporulation protein YunB [Oscillospiraceae bacterium]